jgi:CheY-like chemotaxis protein
VAGPLILVVDDAADVRLIVRRLLERAGQRVEVKPTAEAAWEYLSGVRPGLAILDVNLPAASGPDLCRQIRGLPRLAGLPVAIHSQPNRPEDIAAGIDAGADYIISKELLIQPADWQERVREILSGGSSTFQPAWPADRCQHQWRLLMSRLDEPVAAALLRRISGHPQGMPASKVGEWLAETDGTAEAKERLTVFCTQLERLLGSQWCAGLWTALGHEPAPATKS